MKVYLQPPQPSRGLQRIADALTRYAPKGVILVGFQRHTNKFKTTQNDMVIIYAIGRRDAVERQCREALDLGKRYAVIQVCLRSTMSPDTRDWAFIWKHATVVWSYYDLQQAAEADETGGGAIFSRLVNFYHAPLGVDGRVFYPQPSGKVLKHLICTSGQSRLSESVRECVLAADIVGGHGVHLGGKLRLGNHFDCYDGVSDRVVAELLSDCHFVSGLRRKEGFELPAAEGLLCGARPIVFDNSDWRWNYKNWAVYIQETDRQGVVDQLVQLFKQGAEPVTPHEREEAVHWFNWERVCGEFWGRCL